MNFDIVNYSFILQDFAFAMGAGFAVGILDKFIKIFLSDNKILNSVRYMITAFLFAVIVFSYIISFSNYPDVRIYHLIGASLGFVTVDFGFSNIFRKIFILFFVKIKNYILYLIKKINGTICGLVQDINKNDKKQQEKPKDELLKKQDSWVYNL